MSNGAKLKSSALNCKMSWKRKGTYDTLAHGDRLPEDEIQQRVASLRQSLRARLEAAPNRFAKPTHAEAKQLRPSDTHMRGAAKEVESQKMQRALRIRPDYEEGQAFDHELQEQRRMQRIEEREQRREETRRLREERASRLAEDERSARRRAPTDRDDQRRAPSYRPYERERSRSQSPEPYPGDSSRHRRPVSPYQEDAPLAPSRTPSPPPIAREARAL